MTASLCSIAGCDGKSYVRGWCVNHYSHWRRNGDPLAGRFYGPNPERFWAKVNKTETCWLWTAHLSPDGYGRFRWNGEHRGAHRFAWELTNGPIPEGLQIDHLCRVRHCVRPDHLQPVTSRENTLRGSGPSAQNAMKTHCKRGHEFTPENTYFYDGKRRICRACMAVVRRAS